MLKKSAGGVLAGYSLTKTLSAQGHWRLTDSPARTNVALFIHRAVRLIILRVVNLAPVRLREAYSSPRGPR